MAGEASNDGVADHTDAPFQGFSRPAIEWFRTTFTAPTAPQIEGWPRIAASCVYKSPARLGDDLDVHLRVKRQGRTAMTYGVTFRCDGRLVAEGEITTTSEPVASRSTKTACVSDDAAGPTIAGTPTTSARYRADATAASVRSRLSKFALSSTVQNTTPNCVPPMPPESLADKKANSTAFSRA